jgi:hypothetical protein
MCIVPNRAVENCTFWDYRMLRTWRVFMRKTTLIIAIILAMVGASCARQPTVKQSNKIIRSYFTKYGKKYPATIFGTSRVKDVEITKEEEIHKGLVAIESFLTMTDGTVQRINVTAKRAPLGWRFVSWENATGL